MKNDICSVYNITKRPNIPEYVKKIMNDSARCHEKSKINYSEAISFTHCDYNIDDKKIYISEQEFKTYYDDVIGSCNLGWSIPDGCIIHNNTQELLSVFCVPNIVNQKYICRKVEKLMHVAKSELNELTSLYNFKCNKIPEIINLHYYIFIPNNVTNKKIRNVIKKIYRNIYKNLPIFINIKFNIFQTFGEIENIIWKGSDGDFFYRKKKYVYNNRKLKTIKDIQVILEYIEKKNETLELCETFFINFI